MSEIEYLNGLEREFERLVAATQQTAPLHLHNGDADLERPIQIPRPTQRRLSRGWWPVLVVATLVAATVAAAFIPSLLSHSASLSGVAPTNPSGITITAATNPGGSGIGKLGFYPTLAHPLPGKNHPLPLARASSILGAPVALSTIPGMARDDIGPVFGQRVLDGDTAKRDITVVAITYPAVGATVTYGRCPRVSCPVQGNENGAYNEIATQHPEFKMVVVTISGVPALYTPPSKDDKLPHGEGSLYPNQAGITFVKHGTEVTIHIPGATQRQIIAVATSIADQT